MCWGGISPLITVEHVFMKLSCDLNVFKSWVSSSPLANLMLNVSICSVSLLWLLKWGSCRLFFQFASRSLQVPWDSLLGREVCVLQKEKLDWGYPILCGLLHI